MKKIISLLITLAMVIACLPVAVYAEDATVTLTGSGTSTDPYQIATADQLKYMRDTVNSGDGKSDASQYYVLTADIDLKNEEWVPIGWAIGKDKDNASNNNYEFTGTFDGNGYAIKNFKITEAAAITSDTATGIAEGGTKYFNNVGLFGAIQGGTVKNLGIENVTINVNAADTATAISKAGALVGRLTGTVTNCYAKNVKFDKADDNANCYAGGLIGFLRGTATITDCYVYGVEFTTEHSNRVRAAGFANRAENADNKSVLTNCYAADITSDGLSNCYAFSWECKGGTSVPTFTNCWSTAIDKINTTEIAECTADSSRGNQGATKKGLIAALVDNGDGGYVIDKNVNNGYPCLAFEKQAIVPATDFAGGLGTSTDPYEIATAEQLVYMRNLINDSTTNESYNAKYYELTADIDLEGAEWEPIGYDATYLFNGKFDGNGHVVKNINITQAYGNYLGFFGHVGNANVEISNLGIENLTIDCDDDTFAAGTRIAGMVGRGGGTYKNCYVKDFDVKKSSSDIKCKVGLFMSELRKATTFENCYVYDCEVTGTGIGELAGFARYSESAEVAAFTNCYTANITTDCSKVYPFSYTYTNQNYVVTHTPVNCWSSLAPKGADATYLTCSDTDGASRDQIRTAFTGVTGYQLKSNINDGYPALSFETAPKTVDYVVAAVVPGDNIKVNLIENTAVSGATVYVATYDSYGRFLDADVATVASPYEFTTDLSSEGASELKVFVWNTNQTPLADAYEGKIVDGELINIDELSYSVNNGVMTIEYAKDIEDYESFSETPWSGETTVTKLVVGDNVTGIGANAFSGFTNLETVEIPESVATIADSAFPSTDFTIYGYANGAAEEYAKENGNKFLLKKLRILTIGNSHTVDHGQWNKEIFGDIKDAGIETDIVYQRVTNGGFRMYFTTAKNVIDNVEYLKSHYEQAHNPSGPYYAKYAAQLDNHKWDIVMIQDYRESSLREYEYDFTEGMAETVKWLKEKQPNAKIGWIVDWNDKNHKITSTDGSRIPNKTELQQMYYDKTVATVNEVKAMTENKPDFIIPMGTALQNARTTYLWDVNNAADCYTNYDNNDWCGSAEEIVTFNLLERDGTHCSYELGRYIMGAAVFGYLYSLYQDNLIGGDKVNFCDSLKTMPVTTGVNEWKGEFTQSIWDIVKETTRNTIANPWTITDSVYTTDPAIAMAEKVESATYSDFTAAGIVSTIKALGDGFTISESDVTISEDGNSATVRFLYGYSEKTVTISK